VSRQEIETMGMVAEPLEATSLKVELDSSHEILAAWSLARPVAV
jgi:translation initiation factor IF-1